MDTSSDYLSLVLTSHGGILSSLRLLAGRRMSEELLCQIDNLVVSNGINIQMIGEFYAVTGPGSFTGVRIGTAMAMGLAEGMSKPCYGFSSLDAAAISSGLTVCKAASKLKGDIFAVREYDFNRNEFSDYFCKTIDQNSLSEYVIVNSGSGTCLFLEKAVSDGRYDIFRSECSPLYLRKSEAELNLDKKRLCS